MPWPLIALAGPTASGKSELALRLAGEFSGEIVHCDSVQVYRRFDLGTAKLPVEARRGIPHHLLDIVDPGVTFTAGEYARRARQALNEIRARGRRPIVAGGTGFYFRALFQGLAPGPERDERLRVRLSERERRRAGLLHRLLRRFDRSAANRIHPRDVQKLIRAVEICMLARRPVSEVHAAGRNPLEGFTILKLALDPPREALYERINRRTREMFQSGLLDEIRCILAAGYPPEAKPFDSVGYKQALAHLRGDMTLNEAIAAASQATRNYAKRQWTWFRREPGLQWLPAFGDDPAVQQEAIDGVRKFLERARPTWPATGVRF